ncbi:cytokine receptor common subunit gamma isoform X1 [Rhineura floridana]|uniref:cytokine receptor common subunit gamma isoform X1 n=1 Tax=Rhineura floridana TaxID=261503 RepID=UPI002AC8723E|nr:cytokine receptor common subunit gamma isoform X1 [Rhineura floridana]
MEASKVQKMLPVLLLLFLGPGEQTAGSSQTQGLECIVFNEEYMTCDWGSRQKPTANYSLYYWYDIHEAPQECEHYIQSDGINTGCWFSDVDLDYYFNAYISVNHSRNSSVLEQHVLLQHRVKPSPPINLSIQNMSNNQLLLTWGSSKIPHHCLEHIVKYKSNKDTDWMEQKTQVMKFNLVSVDPEKFYTFFVRSKMSESCASTNLWSDEAGPVTWGKNATTKGSANEVQSMYFWIQSILIPVGSLFLLLFMVLALMRMERVWLILMPRIPNPSNKFEDLFTAHQGNFSEWAGVSKDAMESFKPNYRESICRVSELLPGGGYLPVCNDTMGKAGGVAGISGEPTPKVDTK